MKKSVEKSKGRVESLDEQLTSWRTGQAASGLVVGGNILPSENHPLRSIVSIHIHKWMPLIL